MGFGSPPPASFGRPREPEAPPPPPPPPVACLPIEVIADEQSLHDLAARIRVVVGDAIRQAIADAAAQAAIQLPVSVDGGSGRA